jgi:DNA anti-recombination protein RmuC
MLVTPSGIDEVLEELKDLLDQITDLRDRVRNLENEMDEELNQAQQEYEEKLGSLNAEAARLRHQKGSLKTRLDQLRKSRGSSDTIPLPPADIPEVAPPKPILSKKTSDPPEPPPLDPRMVRKRALADHIYYFADPDQETVVQQINAILSDESASLGEMLELLAWGDIWKARADWESLRMQYERLKEWQSGLEVRLDYWKCQLREIESGERYSLWETKSQGERRWQDFLEEVAEKQRAENRQLAHEVTVLRQELQSLKVEEGMTNG